MLALTLTSLLCALPDGGARPDAALPPLLPRAVLFGGPAYAGPQLSPDGRRVAALVPDARRVLQLEVRAVGQGDAVVVTAEPTRSVRTFRWTEDGAALLFEQDARGDGRTHVFVVDVATRATRDLTPWPGATSEVLETSARAPAHVLVTTNRRDARVVDVVRIDWRSGAVTEHARNPGDVVQWFADVRLEVRAAMATLPGGKGELRVRDTLASRWRPLITASFDERLTPFGFTLDGKSLLLASTVSSDTDRVIEKSLASGTERLLATHPRSDVVAVSWNRATSALRAVAFEAAGRREWTALEWTFSGELAALSALAPGDVDVVSADRADARWVVSFSSDTRPPTFVVWDRKAKQATTLPSSMPQLEPAALAPTTPVSLTARDGLVLDGLLTRPLGDSAERRPLVVLVHDGPWSRASRSFSPVVQHLANRQAVVLQVDVRGSTGRGKRFLGAGDRQWGLSVQTDLLDAVAWAIAQGFVDPARVAIMGHGFGGHAALLGLTRAPQTYRCGVAFAAPVNLLALVEVLPLRSRLDAPRFHRRFGDPRDPAQREALAAASVTARLPGLAAPLLIGAGAQDALTQAGGGLAALRALEASGRAVDAVEYPDEGASLAGVEHRLDFAQRTEALLGRCLGTRVER
ncbi:MAG: S9 family peptidase [Myxococcaceae bacterium]|nr:S9 family peptidase [Myxococcaceae bacterium]